MDDKLQFPIFPLLLCKHQFIIQLNFIIIQLIFKIRIMRYQIKCFLFKRYLGLDINDRNEKPPGEYIVDGNYIGGLSLRRKYRRRLYLKSLTISLTTGRIMLVMVVLDTSSVIAVANTTTTTTMRGVGRLSRCRNCVPNQLDKPGQKRLVMTE